MLSIFFWVYDEEAQYLLWSAYWVVRLQRGFAVSVLRWRCHGWLNLGQVVVIWLLAET